MARLKLSNNVFFGTNGLCKTRQTLVLHWVPDKGCKHGRVPAERHIPRRRASRAASRVLRSWKCAQERHQLDPLCSKGKRRLMGSVETSLLYTFKQDVGGVIRSQARVKIGSMCVCTHHE
ncbi:hypothetical protein TNCV_2380171 [Trichonephila clavipes]|nr:hypothetical protein TNCV_2380171 [Trichonephila clavipes]